MIPLEKIKAADAMQSYIEHHLQEKITLSALAKCCSYSPWHATRIFKEVLEVTPFEYIRKRRLSEATKDLWDENGKILEISLDYLFDSHDGFTRAFTKQFHMTPKQYQKKTPPLPLYMPCSIRDHYRYLQGNDPIESQEPLSKSYFVQVMHFPARKLLYCPCEEQADEYFSYVECVGCDVWGVLCSIKEAMYEPVGVWFPDSLKPENCSSYVQGVEVPLTYDKPLPDGFALLTLPAADLLVFQGEPFEDERFGEAVEYLSEEIENYHPELYGYEWDDQAAPRIQLEPQGYRGYIEARPVKAIKRSCNALD